MKQLKNLHQTTILGELIISPPLSIKEVDFLTSFIDKYHIQDDSLIDNGLYEIKKKYSANPDTNNINFAVLANTNIKIILKFSNQELIPSNSCSLKIVTEEDGTSHKITIQHKHNERKYSPQWIVFFIEHFFKQNAIAPLLKEELSFLKPHNLNGLIWQKAGETWNAQKISVENNEVYLQYASTLVFDEKTKFNVNILNHKSVILQNVGSSSNNNKYYKQYHDLTIQKIAQHNHLTPKNKIIFPKNDLLDKLILNSNLKKDLPFRDKNNNKVIKV